MAARLGYSEADDLRRDVSLAARRIGQAVDLTVRAARQALPQHRVLSFIKRERKPNYVHADHGLIISSGEVGLRLNVARIDSGPMLRVPPSTK